MAGSGRARNIPEVRCEERDCHESREAGEKKSDQGLDAVLLLEVYKEATKEEEVLKTGAVGVEDTDRALESTAAFESKEDHIVICF